MASSTANARRYRHALREISKLGDGVPMWVAGSIAQDVAENGMTFEEAREEYERGVEGQYTADGLDDQDGTPVDA